MATRATRPLVVLTALLALATAEEPELWHLGTVDHAGREFALAPDGWSRYRDDACFLVGRSDPARDWPYVLPGPQDAWAGHVSHTATVVFALAAVGTQGEGRLVIDLVDTQHERAPLLAVRINGHGSEHQLAPGTGDASIGGTPAAGRPQQVVIPVPAGHLLEGDNLIEFTVARGSWLLWDAVRLIAPAGTRLGTCERASWLSGTRAVRGLVERDGTALQPVETVLRHLGADEEVTLRCAGASATVRATAGATPVRLLVPAVEQEQDAELVLEAGGRRARTTVTLQPVRRLTIYVLNHSHTDIGYTDLQPAIERKQVENLVQGIAIARATAGNPPGSRFVWNVEVGWAADLYQRRLTPEERTAYDEAVRKGWVSLQGLYLNMLTGLCRPEELIRTCRFATREAARLGVVIDAAMISDVPGYTWGTVTALAQAGIRYFSVAPNYFDRIGNILVQWENRPFWWVSQSGRERVLVWIPWRGYAMSHEIKGLDAEFMARYQEHMVRMGYPYDITYMRWSGHGDNAVPERQPTDFAREWNAAYAWPKLVISSTSEAFAAFEKRHGAQLPEVRGDWTPYWEDGAGSSAAETALNRASAERLAQAQAICALRDVPACQPEACTDAWNATMLYSEHTWGAWCSISDPEHTQTRSQWAIKQGYALEADRRSRELLAQATGGGTAAGAAAAIDVYNTCSWTRSDVVTVPKGLSEAGDRVLDAAGAPVPSQRLGGGGLCFLVRDIPPLCARRFTIAAGAAAGADAQAITVTGDGLDNGLVRVRLDRTTGAIAEFGGRDITGNLADTASGHAPNDYLYLIGDRAAEAQRNGPVAITVQEQGPLVASLAVDSDAPGCRHLKRTVRVIAGLDRVELDDLVDKARAPATPGHKDYHQASSKESVNLAFPFAVPGGQIWIDLPFAVIRPEQDQMPSACKNWFSVGRWVEVASKDAGVTWATLDAPLIQVGGITATLLNSQKDPRVWRTTVAPTQAFYVWAMNNHWGTNYRAYQEGPVSFRFALRPHRGCDLAAAARFGTGMSQPLIAVPASGAPPAAKPRLTLSADDVLVSGFAPCEDGRGWMVRLYGAGGADRSVTVSWSDPQPASLWLSGTGEQRGARVEGAIAVPAWGLVTLRAER